MTTFRALLKTMRPHQWTKNVLIFAALVFDGQLFIVASLLSVISGFILLCLTASTIYIINDLVDLESDRQHPKKRLRPLASGTLPVRVAIAAAVILPTFSLALAWALSPLFAGVLLVYFVLHIAYSFALKHVVLLDILTITAGFLLRVLAGVAIISVERFSPWLYVCSAMLSLFLAVGKRRQEYVELGEQAGQVRRVFQDYNLPLLDEMLRLSILSTLLTYVLYTIETPFYAQPFGNTALLTIPFVLYALMRYMYLILVRNEGSAPDEVLLKDRPLQLAIALWGLLFVLIIYFQDNLLNLG